MLVSVTLDQLRMLVAVANAGSFTAAAKHVQRAQSAVSHAIATVEEQLGVTLFDRSTKRPTFTPYGETILAEARMVLVRAERLRATAPDHPLAQLARPLADADLADHRQITPTSRVAERFEHTLVHDVWEVADLSLHHQMILRGVAWGTLPLEVAEPSLATGRLARLQIEARPEHALRAPLFAISRIGDALGPARRWLIEAIRAALGD